MLLIVKCNDEESTFILKSAASRCWCEIGLSKDSWKITSEQPGPKESMTSTSSPRRQSTVIGYHIIFNQGEEITGLKTYVVIGGCDAL